jgi:hypothetical protein
MLQHQAMAPGRLAILGHLGSADLLDQFQVALDLARVVVGRTLPPVANGDPGGA